MIANPPHIVTLLRAWQLMARVTGPERRDAQLALHLRALVGHQPYDAFLRTYQLYLQSIPLDTAKAAWGINAAAVSQPTRQPK